MYCNGWVESIRNYGKVDGGMTTTELIELLKKMEHGASGRAREISLAVGEKYISNANFKFYSSGDGCAGATLCLKIESEVDGE